MPAHKSPAAIGIALKSNGGAITAVDWRANHLVDGLAKLAATEGATSSHEAKLVSSAESLVKHCAGQLAVATHVANNVVEHYVDESGRNRTRTRRDSQEAPRSGPKKLKALAALDPKPPTPIAVTTMDDDSDSQSEQFLSKGARRRAATALRKKR